MKKFSLLSAVLAASALFIGCGGKNEPGRVYMPDMAYSRTYETYDGRDSAKFTTDPYNKGGNNIYFDNLPVAGTIKRGEAARYTQSNDSLGYLASAAVKNPYDTLSTADLSEAGRLYNINCAICHGDKGAGNGPIATAGHIGGIANLTLDAYVKMADGTMFHSMTYGKNLMGSYASQLDSRQRWMIVKYVRTLQPKAAGADSTKTIAKVADSTAKKG